MVVKCISAYPSEAQVQELGPRFRRGRSFGVVVGREYLVLGLSFGVPPMAAGVWVDILMEPDIPTLIQAPLCLFEITDPRVSRFWEIRVSGEGVTTLCPASFCQESYHERLSDRVPEVVEDFWRTHRLLLEESRSRAQLDRAAWSN